MTAVRDDHGPVLWRAVTVVLAALVIAALTAAPASAHAELTGSDPEDEDTVTEAPGRVVLEFSEEVNLPQVEVLDPDGESVIDGDAEDLGDVMEQPLGDLTAQGTYTVQWRVVSQDDHPIEGDFTFEYEGPVPGDETAEEEPAPGESAGDDAAGDDAAADEPAEEPAEVEEEADEELVAEPTAAETDEGGAPTGLIAAVVVIALVGAAFFALRGRGAGKAEPEA